MTVKEKLQGYLFERGMFESQAQKVMEMACPKIDKVFKKLKMPLITWDRPAEEYPTPIYKVLFIQLKPFVLEWIEANAPNAWFKPVFMPEPEKEIDVYEPL